MAQFNFQGIGTTWQIEIYQELDKAEESSLLLAIKDRVEVFDKNYSRFRDDSLVTKFSKETGTFVLPPDAEKMFSLYHDLYLRTDGFFTPLIGNLISDAGYDAKYSFQTKKELVSPMPWEEAIDYQSPNLVIKKPVILDFGAAGKGYLIDLVSEVIEAAGISQYCIDAGGDILHKNKTPIRVGLENPENLDQVVGVYTLGDGSICGSAGNRRKWGDFMHIINPKTRSSNTDILALWVVASSAMVADALATCLFFVKPEKLSETYDFEYFLIRSDHSIEKSANFSGEIFT